jgi:hypothetical protein
MQCAAWDELLARGNSGPVPYPKVERAMGRNLTILAVSLAMFALISCGIAYSNIARQPGSPGDVSLWRTMGLALFVLALLTALGGVMSSLFEQAKRRSEETRRRGRS